MPRAVMPHSYEWLLLTWLSCVWKRGVALSLLQPSCPQTADWAMNPGHSFSVSQGWNRVCGADPPAALGTLQINSHPRSWDSSMCSGCSGDSSASTHTQCVQWSPRPQAGAPCSFKTPFWPMLCTSFVFGG